MREQLDAGEEPSFLSERGIDVGKPYFSNDTPFTRSGFGAFQPLAAALADEASPSASGGTAGKRRGGRAPRVLGKLPMAAGTAFVLAAVVGGLAGAGIGYLIDEHDTAELARSASNAYSRQTPPLDEAVRSLHDQVAAGAADDAVAVAPEAMLTIAPEDIAELSKKVKAMPYRTALLIWEVPAAAPFSTDSSLLHEQLVAYSGYEIVLSADPGYPAVQAYSPDLTRNDETAPPTARRDEPAVTAYSTEVESFAEADWKRRSSRYGYAETRTRRLETVEPAQPLPGTAQYEANRRAGLRKSALLAIPAVPIGLVAAFIFWNTDHDRQRRYRESKQ